MKTKILICIFLFLLVALAFSPFRAEAIGTTETVEEINIEQDPVITEYKSEEDELWLWNTLMKYTENEKVTAGILGIFRRESYYKSDAVANWFLFKSIDISKEFVDTVDAGLADKSTRHYFAEQCHFYNGGFGLMQLWSILECESYYDYCVEHNATTIADAEIQCAWAVEFFQTLYPEIWEELYTIERIETIGKKCAIFLDGASPMGQESIAYYTRSLYEKYGTQ